MGPLDWLKQKLGQGLSGLASAGGSIVHGVENAVDSGISDIGHAFSGSGPGAVTPQSRPAIPQSMQLPQAPQSPEQAQQAQPSSMASRLAVTAPPNPNGPAVTQPVATRSIQQTNEDLNATNRIAPTQVAAGQNLQVAPAANSNSTITAVTGQSVNNEGGQPANNQPADHAQGFTDWLNKNLSAAGINRDLANWNPGKGDNSFLGQAEQIGSGLVKGAVEPVVRGGEALSSVQNTGQLGESGKQFAADVVSTGMLGVGGEGALAEDASKTIFQNAMARAGTGAIVGGTSGGAQAAAQPDATPASVFAATVQSALAGAGLSVAVGGASDIVRGTVGLVRGRVDRPDTETGTAPQTEAPTPEAAPPPESQPAAAVHEAATTPAAAVPETASRPIIDQAQQVVRQGQPETISSAEPTTEMPLSQTAHQIQDYLQYSTERPEFGTEGGFDLERNLNKLLGHGERTNLLAQRIYEPLVRKAADDPDYEQVLHHMENPAEPLLNERQDEIYQTEALPLSRSLAEAHEALSGTPQERGAEGYVPRIALGKNNKVERYMNRQTQDATQNSLNRSASTTKSRTMMKIVDPRTGEEHLVAITTPKDKTGRAITSDRHVYAVGGDKEPVDLGRLHKELPTPVKEFVDPVLDEKLNEIAGGLGIDHERVVRLRQRNAAGISYTGRGQIKTRAASPADVILHEIGHQVDDKYGLQKIMFGGPRPKSDMILTRQIEKAKREVTGGPASHKAFMEQLAGDRADMIRAERTETLARAKQLMSDVRAEGGLKPSGSFDFTDIPSHLKRKTGFAPDEMAQQLQARGHHVETGDDVLDEIRAAQELSKTAKLSKGDALKLAHKQLATGVDGDSEAYRMSDQMSKSPEARKEVRENPVVTELSRQLRINKELRDLGDARGVAKAYARSGPEKMAVMFQAYLHNPDLFKKIAPTAYLRFTDFLHQHPDTAPILDIGQAKSLQLAKRVVGDQRLPGEFIDKAGRKWQIQNATTKEIEGQTDVRYLHNPVVTHVLGHANAFNAVRANDFFDTWKASPDFAQHAVKSEDADLNGVNKGWKTVDDNHFKGYYFDPQTAHMINKLLQVHKGESPYAVIRGITRAWRGATNVATQFIIANPAWHGANIWQLSAMAVGKGRNVVQAPIAFARLQADAVRLTFDGDLRMKTFMDYLGKGGHIEDYGKDTDTTLTKMLDAAHIKHFNKVNASWMSGIDSTFRLAAYRNLTRSMDGEEAAAAIDHYMGGRGRGIDIPGMMFKHYFTTLNRVAYGTVRHPVAGLGATTNLIIGAAAFMALNKGLQDFSHNKNAHVHFPGLIGYINDLYKAPGEIVSGGSLHLPSVVTAHLNPFINATLDQVAGKNLFTGDSLYTAKQRIQDFLASTVAPYQMLNRTAQGGPSKIEDVLNEFGIYLPHAKGAPAAQGPLSFVNTPGAKPVPNGGDITGYSQEQSYYKGINGAKQFIVAHSDSYQTTENNLAAFTEYTVRDHTADGRSIQADPKQSRLNALTLYTNDTVRHALTQYERQQKNHDPMWDLPDDKLEMYLNYESMYDGDPQRSKMAQANPWIAQFTQARNQWYNQQSLGGNTVKDPWDQAHPYPNLSPQTNSDMATYQTLTDSTQKSDFLSAHPDVLTAFNQLAAYSNARRLAQGSPYGVAQYPTESDHVTAILNSMPQGQDAASKKARAQIINANPDVNQYLADVSLYDVTKNLAQDYLVGQGQTIDQELNNGSSSSQQTLKDLTSLAKYDIGYDPTTNTYQFMQKGGFDAGFAAAGGGSSSKKNKPIIANPRKSRTEERKVTRPPKVRYRTHKVSLRGHAFKQSGKLHPTGFTKPKTGAVK